MELDPDDLANELSLDEDQRIIRYLDPNLNCMPLPFKIIHTESIDMWANPRELTFISHHFCASRGISVAFDRGEIGFVLVPGKGNWRPATQFAEDILLNGQKIGKKRELEYWDVRRFRSKWVMYEYKALLDDESLSSFSAAESIYFKERVVYKLIYKKDIEASDSEPEEPVVDHAHDKMPDEPGDVEAETAVAAASVPDCSEKKDEPLAASKEYQQTTGENGETAAATVHDNNEKKDDPLVASKEDLQTTGIIVGDESLSGDGERAAEAAVSSVSDKVSEKKDEPPVASKEDLQTTGIIVGDEFHCGDGQRAAEAAVSSVSDKVSEKKDEPPVASKEELKTTGIIVGDESHCGDGEKAAEAAVSSVSDNISEKKGSLPAATEDQPETTGVVVGDESDGGDGEMMSLMVEMGR